MTDKKLPIRAKVATSLSRGAAALSRATGRGDGAVIGGKIGMMIDPNLLANLAAGREIAGPAIVEERESTSVLPPGTVATVDEYASLIATVERT